MCKKPQPTFKAFIYLLFTILILFQGLLNAGALIVTGNSIVDETGNSIKSISAIDLLYDGSLYYYILSDGIYSLDGKVKIDIKNAQRVGLNYVLSNLKVYKISNGNATTLASVSGNLKSIQVVSDYIIGIENNQVVCYYGGSVVWSVPTNAKNLKISENYMAVFSDQTNLFNISNPRFPKLERVYPKFSDYVYFSGYHVFSDGSKIYLFKGSARASTTFQYKGTLFTDGKFIYSGNTLINSELVQKDLKFTVKSLVPVRTSGEIQNTQEDETSIWKSLTMENTTSTQQPVKEEDKETTQTKETTTSTEKTESTAVIKPTETKQQPKTPEIYEMVWKVVLNDTISGKPALKQDVAYVPTTKGSVLAITNGKTIWSYKASFVITGHITVGNHIYVVSWDDTVYALNEDGSLHWKLSLDDDIAYGPAWDGYLLYVATDKGTVYVINDSGKSGTVKSTYKVGTYPSLPPSVSLSGKVFVVDGAGNLWRDKTIFSFAGKPKNLPVYMENVYASQQVGFTLIDEYGTAYEFIPMKSETKIYNGKTLYLTLNDEIIDAVLGKRNLYVLGSSGKIYVIDKQSKKTVFSDIIPGGKYISLSNEKLFAFGKEVRCYYVNDNPSGFWNSLYGNQMNWNSAVK